VASAFVASVCAVAASAAASGGGGFVIATAANANGLGDAQADGENIGSSGTIVETVATIAGVSVTAGASAYLIAGTGSAAGFAVCADQAVQHIPWAKVFRGQRRQRG
jgi:hypothetical protein